LVAWKASGALRVRLSGSTSKLQGESHVHFPVRCILIVSDVRSLTKDSIAAVNGADTAQTFGMMAGRKAEFKNWGKHAHLFVRELEDGCPSTWYADKSNPGFWAFDGWGMTTIWKEGEKDSQPMGKEQYVLSCNCTLIPFCSYRVLLPMAIRGKAIAQTPLTERPVEGVRSDGGYSRSDPRMEGTRAQTTGTGQLMSSQNRGQGAGDKRYGQPQHTQRTQYIQV
jgi:hypothetical protein